MILAFKIFTVQQVTQLGLISHPASDYLVLHLFFVFWQCDYKKGISFTSLPGKLKHDGILTIFQAELVPAPDLSIKM